MKRNIRSLGLLIELYDSDAATLVGTILQVWCKAAFPGLPKSSLPYSKAMASEPEIKSFAIKLGKMEFLEATYWLSSSYAMLTDGAYRKKLAMFFTPTSITAGLLNDLVRQGVDFGSQYFMDPACGGAAFLVPVALRIRNTLLIRKLSPLNRLKHIEKNLCGTELDKTLCTLSKYFLCMALHDEIQKTGYIPKFNVFQANSLADLTAYLGRVDIVICNPPYRKMTKDELEPLREEYADIIEGQPNLYCLFVALCIRLLRDGGRAALVTPTSFLSGQYFSRLRKFIIQNSDIEHIGMVSDRQGVFIDVEQETTLTIMRRRIKNDGSTMPTNVSVVSGQGQYQCVGKCLLPDSGDAWPIPRSLEDDVIIKTIGSSKFRLSHYGYRARIGAYVWNRDKRPRFTSLQDAKKANAHCVIPLLWSSDISSKGIVELEDFYSYNGEYRFIDLGNNEISSVVKSPCVVMQRVTSNDQPRRLVTAIVSLEVFKKYGGFIGENHVVILEQVTEKPVLPPTIMAQLLSTHYVDRYFRCISGATNVSVFELNQLALPDPTLLKKAISRHKKLGEAVMAAFGLKFNRRTEDSKEACL